MPDLTRNSSQAYHSPIAHWGAPVLRCDQNSDPETHERRICIWLLSERRNLSKIR